MEVSGQLHAPVALPSALIDHAAGGSQCWSEHRVEEKTSAPAGNQTPIVQKVV